MVDTRRESTMKRSMVKRKRRKFTPEFKADTVRLIRESDKPLAHIARDLDVPHSVLRDWIAQADIDDRQRRPSYLGYLTPVEYEQKYEAELRQAA